MSKSNFSELSGKLSCVWRQSARGSGCKYNNQRHAQENHRSEKCEKTTLLQTLLWILPVKEESFSLDAAVEMESGRLVQQFPQILHQTSEVTPSGNGAKGRYQTEPLSRDSEPSFRPRMFCIGQNRRQREGGLQQIQDKG